MPLATSDPWPRLRGVQVALLPLGSFEQHGESLPLYLDTLVAERVAWEAGARLDAPVLPALPYGVSAEHRDYPLTVWVDPVNYCLFLRDVFASLESHGVRLLAAVNGHGGNREALAACAGHWNYTRGPGGMRVIPIWVWGYARHLMSGEVHAGRLEASVYAYLTGVRASGRGEPGPCYPLLRTSECTSTGSIYPGAFESDPELGERAFRAMVDGVVSEVREALGRLAGAGRL